MKKVNWQKWKARVPLLVALISMAVSLYFAIFYSVRAARLLQSQYTGEEVTYLSWLIGSNDHVTLLGVICVSAIGYFGFLISTRVKLFKKKWLRLINFLIMHVARWSGLIAYGMGGIDSYVIPFFENRLENVITTDAFIESILFEHTSGFYLMLIALPILFVGFVLLFLMAELGLNDQELKKAFFNFEYKGKWLQKFSKLEEVDVWPDVELGLSIKNQEMVTIPGFDRSLNSLIVGGIGTGKTAALALPMLNQDLHHMTRFINAFPTLREREDYLSKDVAGRHLNGITVIEPSNDLCQKTLQLVKAHGIPDEAITYINPLDPNTPSINPMRGPVDKVAEVFAQIIAGLNDSGSSGNFFFEQAQRNHLKQHIYLLKLHDPDLQPTFGALIDMYNNPTLVHKMHEQLKKTLPKNIDDIEERQERNYWKIIQGIDEWFDLTILPKKERGAGGENWVTDDLGNVQYYDAKSEHVQGLRNILNDIGSNPYIRNVLFGESEFDFDEHFAKGGVLLVNTAKGQLVDLARVLGKLVLMNLQNATFRRPNDVSPFHHIMVDEAPDYFYDSFSEFPVQSRKYKVIITTIMQTIAQLADTYGENYMTTIIAGMRNRMVYGDVPAMDAEYFSNLFGEKIVFDEGQTEMSVSPLQDNPQTRGGSSYAKKREQSMTPGEIMFQDAFNCAVKIVVNNQPIPVQRIKANFLPPEAFQSAEVRVGELPLQEWLSYRRGEIDVIKDSEDVKIIEEVDSELVEVEESVAIEKEKVREDTKLDLELAREQAIADKVARMSHDTRPTDKLPASLIRSISFDQNGMHAEIEPAADVSNDVQNEIEQPQSAQKAAASPVKEPIAPMAAESAPAAAPPVQKEVRVFDMGFGQQQPNEPAEIDEEEEVVSIFGVPEAKNETPSEQEEIAYKESVISKKHDSFYHQLQNGVEMNLKHNSPSEKGKDGK